LTSKNELGTPMTYGVGARSSCSEPGMDCGSSGITGNMYWSGYVMLIRAMIDMDRAL